jgi:hypothetical protein
VVVRFVDIDGLTDRLLFKLFIIVTGSNEQNYYKGFVIVYGLYEYLELEEFGVHEYDFLFSRSQRPLIYLAFQFVDFEL